jgi:hypothetical protein
MGAKREKVILAGAIDEADLLAPGEIGSQKSRPSVEALMPGAKLAKGSRDRVARGWGACQPR